MTQRKHRYKDFAQDIDLDAFYEAIDYEVIDHRNGNDIGHCPLPYGLHKHGDTTGKFAVHREKMVYLCFVCGGGNLLSLAMEMNEFDVNEATEWLRQFAIGDTRSDAEFTEYFLGLIEDTKERIASLPFFNERVLERFVDYPEYFDSRGISREVQKEAKLCYGNPVMKPSPRKKGEKIDEDYFGPAAIFPHFWQGRLVGWQHRWLDFGPDTPKWLGKWTNTTDFPKHITIYGYESALKNPDPVIIVESVPTALFLRSHGYNSISTFGGNTETQLRLIRRFQQGVIISPDNDGEGKAGSHFLNSATDYLEKFIPVQHLPPVPGPVGADLNDFAQEDDPGGILKEFLEEAFTPSLL